ncbi:hypothetical protein KEM48_002140 [Puccinia striiformis f. sp. tritici PST-130]|nr:hypothetical protein KEM48_002140 [Puccinia striiformis f. sp. tritici PST-130]
MYYMKHWQDTVDVLIEHLLQWSPGNNHPYLAGYSQARGGHPSDMSQLSCFAPSNWMLGGKLLQNEAIFMLVSAWPKPAIKRTVRPAKATDLINSMGRKIIR